MEKSGSLEGIKVILVEDDKLLGDSLEIFLRIRGFRVKTFGNAEDVRNRGDLGDYDMMISDFLLPGEDGFSLIRHAREVTPNLFTILITAYGREGLEEEARLAGVDAFLYKPFSAAELDRLLERMVLRGKKSGSRSLFEVNNI